MLGACLIHNCAVNLHFTCEEMETGVIRGTEELSKDEASLPVLHDVTERFRVFTPSKPKLPWLPVVKPVYLELLTKLI